MIRKLIRSIDFPRDLHKRWIYRCIYWILIFAAFFLLSADLLVSGILTVTLLLLLDFLRTTKDGLPLIKILLLTAFVQLITAPLLISRYFSSAYPHVTTLPLPLGDYLLYMLPAVGALYVMILIFNTIPTKTIYRVIVDIFI